MDPNAVWKCLCEALQSLGKVPEQWDTRAHVVDCLNVSVSVVLSRGSPQH